MITVLLVGQGNVAFHLKKAFDAVDEVHCLQISSRNISVVPKADIAIVAVSDDAIAEVSTALNTPLVVHTSGGMDIEILKNNTRKGVFYPLQSFSKTKKIDFSSIPIAVEATADQDYQLLETLGNFISTKVSRINSKQREILHVAAVFANNFTNHLFHISENICEEHQIDFDLLHPLMLETASKAVNLKPQQAQTGPAIRNDVQTIKKHLFLLPEKYKEIYQILTDSIQNGN